jgi:adenine-specific DNA-methyltransferase
MLGVTMGVNAPLQPTRRRKSSRSTSPRRHPAAAKQGAWRSRGIEPNAPRATGTLEPELQACVGEFLGAVDLARVHATTRLDPERRGELGQFMTPMPVARLMAGLFVGKKGSVRLLDAGAGVGSLTAAFVAERCYRKDTTNLDVTAYEIDPALHEYLEGTLRSCEAVCQAAGIGFTSRVVGGDFIVAGVQCLTGDLFTELRNDRFDAAILNPPYRKIRSDSMERQTLRQIGVEAGNLYTAFLAIVTRLLVEGGELVAITPRSFCNGPYFRPFR